MDGDVVVALGFPGEQEAFIESNHLFFQRLRHLQAAASVAFMRSLANASTIQSTVFYLGRLVAEDFMEILLLCGNGYGIGGQKLLRGLYERAVTARYLHLNSSEVDAYLEYPWIATQKLIAAIRETFGNLDFDDATLELISRRAGEVRPHFMIPACKKCGTARVNYTWSRLDFVAMAKATGDLGKLIAPAYYEPTQQLHGSMTAVIARLEKNEMGTSFQSGAQRSTARHTLMISHMILLDVLLLQREHFDIEALEEPLATCVNDYLEIWGSEPPSIQPESVKK